MRCYNCKKRFDYEKYYGICPKCGCYNKKETEEETHRAYHAAFDEGYEEGLEEHFRTEPQQEQPQSGVRVEEIPVGKPAGKKGGVLLAVSAVFAALAFAASVLIPGAAEGFLEGRAQAQVMTGLVDPIEHEMGETFRLGGAELTVRECKVLADWRGFVGLEEGMALLAVRVTGSSEGEEGMDVQIEEPYLQAGGHFRKAVSEYEFEPYAQAYDIEYFNRYDLEWELHADGWYIFLTEAENRAGTVYFEERDRSSETRPLEAVHAVSLVWEEEGGESLEP